MQRNNERSTSTGICVFLRNTAMPLIALVFGVTSKRKDSYPLIAQQVSGFSISKELIIANSGYFGTTGTVADDVTNLSASTEEKCLLFTHRGGLSLDKGF